MWRRVVRPGYIEHAGRRHDMFVTIEMNDQRNPQHGPELSITGEVGPKSDGDAWGGCGQNIEDLYRLDGLHDAWHPNQVRRLGEIWDRWHLNGMQAGTPAQMAWLRHNRDLFPGWPIGHYDWAQAALHRAGLEPDDGHRYGSAWKYEEVPADVLAWLRDLPVSSRAHPWGYTDMVRSDITEQEVVR
jgi:hypothetical protein